MLAILDDVCATLHAVSEGADNDLKQVRYTQKDKSIQTSGNHEKRPRFMINKPTIPPLLSFLLFLPLPAVKVLKTPCASVRCVALLERLEPTTSNAYTQRAICLKISRVQKQS